MIDRQQVNGERPHGGLLKRESLREQVTASLRWAIFMGERPPGDRFSVPALAEEFGISPTPVREAVLDLVQQGLVVALPNRGFEVVAPTLEYLQQAMQIRRLLEIPTMLEIARRVTPAEIDGVRSLAAAIMDAAEKGNLPAFVEADYEFHWRLTGLCGNPILTELIEDLRSRARVVAVPAIARFGALVETAQEHLDLLDAIGGRDLASVERITSLHMENTFRGLKETIASSSLHGD